MADSQAELGSFEYDERMRWWSIKVAFGGRPNVKLRVEASSDAVERVRTRATEVVRALDCGALKRFATTKLYSLYATTWRSDDGPDVDENGFAELLRPESIVILEDDAVAVYFDDGDLFAGHVVIVGLDPELQPRGAEIAG